LFTYGAFKVTGLPPWQVAEVYVVKSPVSIRGVGMMANELVGLERMMFP